MCYQTKVGPLRAKSFGLGPTYFNPYKTKNN